MADPVVPVPDDDVMRPLAVDFYRAPTGEWVYKWSDKRMVLVESARLAAVEAERDEARTDAEREMDKWLDSECRAGKIVAERDALAAKVARAERLCDEWDAATPLGMTALSAVRLRAALNGEPMADFRLCEWPVWIGSSAVPCSDPVGPDMRRTWCPRHTDDARQKPTVAHLRRSFRAASR